MTKTFPALFWTSILIGLVPFIFSCTTKKTTPVFGLRLSDSLGFLTFNKPIMFDTVYSWTRTTDYGCGSKTCYRFQSKKIPVIKESGFIIKDYPIDGTFLTISHLLDKRCGDINKNVDSAYSEIISQLNQQRPLTDTIFRQIINKRDYLVIKGGDQFFQTWNYYSIVNNSVLNFHFKSKDLKSNTFDSLTKSVAESTIIK